MPPELFECAGCDRKFCENNYRSAAAARDARNQHQRGAHPTVVDDPASTDPPEGIDVYIVDSGGQDRAQSNDPNFGRSVLFADGMEYTIKITNDTTRNKKIAVNAYIDGAPANLTPLLVGASRTIAGFTKERHTTEVVQNGRYSYNIKNTFKTFVAKKPVTTGWSVADRKIGQVRFEFFAVRMVTMYDGKRNRDHVRARSGSSGTRSQSCARVGVMQTIGGQEVTEIGRHFRHGKRKPMADSRHPLGTITITICDQSRTLLDFMPNPPAGVSSAGPAAPVIDLPDQLRQLQEQHRILRLTKGPFFLGDDIYSLDSLNPEYWSWQDLR